MVHALRGAHRTLHSAPPPVYMWLPDASILDARIGGKGCADATMRKLVLLSSPVFVDEMHMFTRRCDVRT